MPRLFIGIPAQTPEIKKLLDLSLKPSLKFPRWTPFDNLHVTLLFLGNVPPSLFPSIKSAFNQTPFTPFTLTFSRLLYAPLRKPRMIWLQAEEHKAFYSLQNKLYENISPLLPELPPPKPKIHITLARFRSKPKFPELPPFAPLILKAEKLILYESSLTPRGAEYHRVSEK